MALPAEHNTWVDEDYGSSPDYEPIFRECRLLPPTSTTTAADVGKLWVVGKRLGEVSTIVPTPDRGESDRETWLALSKAWAAIGGLETFATSWSVSRMPEISRGLSSRGNLEILTRTSGYARGCVGGAISSSLGISRRLLQVTAKSGTLLCFSTAPPWK